MATRKPEPANDRFSKFLHEFGWDLFLGSIAAFYMFTVPFTKVEESFNVQAMHDILYHQYHIEKYDHLDFPGVVSRTFVGALIIAILASPVVLVMQFLHMPKIYSLFTVRLVLGCMVLSTLRFFRIQVRRKFGHHVEAFFVILTAAQFHLLFYSTRPLPNILAFALVNLAYSFWFKGNSLATLKCLLLFEQTLWKFRKFKIVLAISFLIGLWLWRASSESFLAIHEGITFATIIFRCDTVLLFGPIGVELLLSKSISLWEAVKCCISTALLCIGLTVLLDTIMWQKLVWPELEVFWFNSVLNRSSEWGTHSFHWYFTSALPRSLLVAYPLSMLGVLLDRRILRYIAPVFTFVLLYSKLPHKELRFIIGSIPIFNVSAAIAASRVYNNRKKNVWRWLYIIMLGSFLVSLGCSIITFMASYDNYPGAYALKALHQTGASKNMRDKFVHIDPFSAMNGISRFSENYRWRYSKEEGIALEEYRDRNFSFLLNEHSYIDGFKCLFAVNGFSKARLQIGFPPIVLLKEPKVFVHGTMRDQDIALSSWPGCP